MKELFKIAEERFGLEPEQEYAPVLAKKKQMVDCQLLMENMESRGALDEEKENLLLYMAVLVNADKMRLDWAKALEELKINDLFDFYN